MKTLTKRLNKLKGKQSLRAFSERCHIDNSTMYNYLNGRDIPARMLIKIIKATNCNPAWLLGISEDSSGNAKITARICLNEMKATANSLLKFAAEYEERV